MVNTASKLLKALCSMVVMLALVASITAMQIFAASHGIYTATATPHYKHPNTGVIEDSGGEGSSVLGQSMVDSATEGHALVEVDANGNTYATIRLNLSQYTSNQQFYIDTTGTGSYSAVSATVMQEDYANDTTDYRIQVPSENTIIRCTMYVEPMGRNVVWYITLSNLQAGSRDFITSITVNNTPAQQEETVPAQPQEPVQEPAASSASETTSAETVSSETASSEISSEVSSDTSSVLGIQEFDAAGNTVSNVSSGIGSEASGANTAVIWGIIGGVVAVIIIGGCVWYFCFFKKKS